MNVQNPAASRGIAIQAVDLVKNYGAGSNTVHDLLQTICPRRFDIDA